MPGHYHFLECMSANHKSYECVVEGKDATSNTFDVNGQKIIFSIVYFSWMFGRVDGRVYLQNCVNTCED